MASPLGRINFCFTCAFHLCWPLVTSIRQRKLYPPLWLRHSGGYSFPCLMLVTRKFIPRGIQKVFLPACPSRNTIFLYSYYCAEAGYKSYILPHGFHMKIISSRMVWWKLYPPAWFPYKSYILPHGLVKIISSRMVWGKSISSRMVTRTADSYYFYSNFAKPFLCHVLKMNFKVLMHSLVCK